MNVEVLVQYTAVVSLKYVTFCYMMKSKKHWAGRNWISRSRAHCLNMQQQTQEELETPHRSLVT
jgi:hypothetical protein